ncbi:MAG: DUF1064 domain-containing protein [Planctomycetota bacterium]
MAEKVTYGGITFDSPDEREFYWWCEEAKANELIEDFGYQQPTFRLADPVYEFIERTGAKGQKLKPKRKTVLQGITYTVDFHLIGIRKGVAVSEFLDVKPAFTLRDSTASLFSAIRKWVYQRHSVLVFPVVPKELFGRTFAPANSLLTPKTRKPRKGYQDFLTVEQYVSELADDTTSFEGEPNEADE